MEPRSPALSTGERAARTARCARNVSPLTANATSEPSPLSSRRPRLVATSGGGGVGAAPSRTMTPHTNVTRPSGADDDDSSSRSLHRAKWLHPYAQKPSGGCARTHRFWCTGDAAPSPRRRKASKTAVTLVADWVTSSRNSDR